MASAAWKHLTKQEAAALNIHNGKIERAEHNHSNVDIDKSKSNLNLYIGGDDYCDMYNAMVSRVEQVDSQNPPLRKVDDKKRPICESIYVPCPQAIYDMGYDKAVEFFYGGHDIFRKYFGEDNTHGMCVHFDEIHEYTDPVTKKKVMSLSHGTELVSCYCEWSEDITKNVKQDNGKYKKIPTGEKRERKGINHHNFERRERYNEINRLIDDYCMRTFGVAFLTGQISAKGKTAEQLKNESKLAEQDELIKKKSDKLNELDKDIIFSEAQRDIVKDDVDKLITVKDDTTAELTAARVELAEVKSIHSTLSAENYRLEARNIEIKAQGDEAIAAITQVKANTAAEVEKADKLRKENDDFVKSLQPLKEKTITRKVRKGLKTEIVTETVPLTNEQIAFNQALQAAQAVIRSDEQRKDKAALIEKAAIAKAEAEIAKNRRITELAERRTSALLARASIAPAYKAKYSRIFAYSDQIKRSDHNENNPFEAKQNHNYTTGQKQSKRE